MHASADLPLRLDASAAAAARPAEPGAVLSPTAAPQTPPRRTSLRTRVAIVQGPVGPRAVSRSALPATCAAWAPRGGRLKWLSPAKPVLGRGDVTRTKRIDRATRTRVAAVVARSHGAIGTVQVDDAAASRRWSLCGHSRRVDNEDPRVFLECSTAPVKVGPFWSPRFTLVVLRVGNETFSLNTLGQALRGRGSYEFTTKTRAAFEILTDDSTHGVPVLAA